MRSCALERGVGRLKVLNKAFDGGTGALTIDNIDHQWFDVRSRLVVHDNLLFDCVADNINNEPSALEIQGDGASNGLGWRTSYHHYLKSSAISGLLGSPFLAMSLLSHQDVCDTANRDQPNGDLDLIRGNPVMYSSVQGGGGGGLDERPRRRERTRTRRLGEPGRGGEGLSQGI